jgi:hypothetical protein
MENQQSWDCHADLVGNHTGFASETDQPVAALLADLEQRGLLVRRQQWIAARQQCVGQPLLAPQRGTARRFGRVRDQHRLYGELAEQVQDLLEAQAGRGKTVVATAAGAATPRSAPMRRPTMAAPAPTAGRQTRASTKVD